LRGERNKMEKHIQRWLEGRPTTQEKLKILKGGLVTFRIAGNITLVKK